MSPWPGKRASHDPFTAASWFPNSLIGAENLCHQAIFVDDTTRAVAPPDPEVIEVGDAIWQGAQWRSLVQGAVRPVRIVEILVLPQHRHQVALVPDQGPVQQLTTRQGRRRRRTTAASRTRLAAVAGTA